METKELCWIILLTSMTSGQDYDYELTESINYFDKLEDAEKFVIEYKMNGWIE